ncbi:MAG: N-methyl-L-tryptophan oxidase [Granulosicoccus sp.]
MDKGKFGTVVVGLGAMGAATLYQLSKHRQDLLGIEQFDLLHEYGSSHGETRLTRRATAEGSNVVPFVTESHRIWRELEMCPEDLFVESGVLIIGRQDSPKSIHGTENFLATSIQLAKTYGVSHEVLNAPQIRRRFPAFAPNDKELGYLELEAGYVFPHLCIAAQLDRARKHGAMIRERTRVTCIRPVEAGVILEIDGDDDIRCDSVVIAVGGWTGPLLGKPFSNLLTVQRQVLHWFETVDQEIQTATQMPAFIWLHGEGDAEAFYGFPPIYPGTAVKVATEQSITRTTAEELERQVLTSEGQEMYTRHVKSRLPNVSNRQHRSVACTYTTTPDHGFIIDHHPDSERVHVICACSGHGFKHSAGIGRAVAERVLGKTPFTDLSSFTLMQRR